MGEAASASRTRVWRVPCHESFVVAPASSGHPTVLDHAGRRATEIAPRPPRVGEAPGNQGRTRGRDRDRHHSEGGGAQERVAPEGVGGQIHEFGRPGATRERSFSHVGYVGGNAGTGPSGALAKRSLLTNPGKVGVLIPRGESRGQRPLPLGLSPTARARSGWCCLVPRRGRGTPSRAPHAAPSEGFPPASSPARPWHTEPAPGDSNC